MRKKKPTATPPESPLARAWRDLGPEPAPASPPPPADSAAIGFDGVRAEALASVQPGHAGTLAWIDARCQAAGMHALDAWWLGAFGAFYASGKMVFAGRIGLRGGKSVSVCRALVNDALFTLRDLDPSTPGVVPIFSANRTEATDRFVAIRAILSACGIRDARAEDDDERPGGIGGTYTHRTLPSGGGVIATQDSQGHPIEFRIYPATLRSAIGFTAIGGFCDEVDLWQDRETGANPADRVLELLFQRFTTQPTAKLYIVSACYGIASAHTRIIDAGDTDLQHIARLGDLGAARDDAARASLARRPELVAKPDPRLVAKADPQSPAVPSWVTSPLAPIGRSYDLAKGRLDALFRESGARPGKSGKGSGTSAGEIRAMIDFMRRAAAIPGPGLNDLPRMASPSHYGVDVADPLSPTVRHLLRPFRGSWPRGI